MSCDEWPQQLDADGVWRAAIPLPWQFVLHDRCECGRRFWLRGRVARYRAHWRRAHG